MAVEDVRLNFVGFSQEAQVVWAVDNIGALTPEAIAQSFYDNMWLPLKPETSLQVALVSIAVGDSSTGFVMPVNEQGTGTGLSSPLSNSALITKLVSGGRNGRMFWPGLQENDVDPDGRLTTLQRDALDNATAGMTADFQQDPAGQLNLGVKSNPGGIPGFNQVIGFVTGTVLGTQRRRIRS